SRRQAAHVLRQPPQLLVGQELLVDQVGEGRHRRTVEAGAQPAVDVGAGRATAESPALMEIRGEDRESRVILERRRGGPVASPLIAMTLAAPDGVVELSPDCERLGTRPASRLAPELERHDVLTRIREEPRAG